MKKVLFLTAEIPFPLDNGGKIRTYNLLKSIGENSEIDLICFSEEKENSESIKELMKFCSDVSVINKIFTNSSSVKVLIKNIFKSLFSLKPFIVQKFMDNEYRKAILTKIDSDKYDFVVIDHLNICGYKDILKNKKIILSQHNCEYLILKRRYEEEKNIIKKVYLKIEYMKTRNYEKEISKAVHKVIMLTEEDKKSIIDRSYDGSNIEILPISIQNTYLKTNAVKKINKVLFLGTMSWYPNEQGIKWFLDEVWNELKQMNNEAKLYIVGKSPSSIIKNYANEDIIITGYVEDVNKYIEECDICIVPLFIGGGMRVKILECMSKGIPIISTSIGAEGIKVTDGKDILIANDRIEFINQFKRIDNLSLYENIRANALELFNSNYSSEALIKKVDNIFNII